jgi:hypothetical protein
MMQQQVHPMRTPTSTSTSSGPMSGDSTHGRTSTPLTLRDGFDGNGTRSSARFRGTENERRARSPWLPWRCSLTFSCQQERMSSTIHRGIPTRKSSDAFRDHDFRHRDSRSDTHLTQPKAPPRRMVSLCSVYTTILVSSGSSSGEGVEVDGSGKAGKGRRRVGRV